MLARDFGYWVSEGGAADHPTTAHRMDGFAPSDRVWTALGVAGFSFFVAVVTTRGFEDDDPGFLGWAATIACMGALLAALVMSFDEYENRRRHALLRVNPWQAWPIRMDKRHEFHILDPDQQVVKTVNGVFSPVPDRIWRDAVDGVGVVWICGDLREKIVVAPVGGDDPIFLARTRTPRSFDVVDELKKAAMAAAVNAAGAAAMRTFLNPDE